MLEQNMMHRAHLPEGWRPLFDELMAELHALDPALEIIQAKEKFGELCVYLRTYCPTAGELIEIALLRSKRTCQVCGEDAFLRVSPHRLYQTLCHDHRGEFVPIRLAPSEIHLRLIPGGKSDEK